MNNETQGQEKGEISPDTPSIPLPLPVKRLPNGHFVKGSSGNPRGKRKGTATQRTEKLKDLMQHALSDRLGAYLEALDFLRASDPKAFAQEYRFLLEFFVPKPQRIESTNLNIEAKEAQVIQIGATTFELR